MSDIFTNVWPYKQVLSRDHRGFLIFLLDQSGSMEAKIGAGDYTIAQIAADTLNVLLSVVALNAGLDEDTGGRKDNCDILVLGYGHKVEPLLGTIYSPVSIPNLVKKEQGKRWLQLARRVFGTGQMSTYNHWGSYWVDACTDGTKTEMVMVLQEARKAAEIWLNATPGPGEARRSESFPPIVINITDGQHNGDGDPVQAALELRELGTSDGTILLFNCHLTDASTAKTLTCPANVQAINELPLSAKAREGARQLFEMSSEIPASMQERANNTFRVILQPGARGFTYNANASDLVDFLCWGTRTKYSR